MSLYRSGKRTALRAATCECRWLSRRSSSSSCRNGVLCCWLAGGYRLHVGSGRSDDELGCTDYLDDSCVKGKKRVAAPAWPSIDQSQRDQMAIFRAPLAHRTKSKAFQGANAIRMPTSEDEEDPSSELDAYSTQSKVLPRAERSKPAAQMKGFLREESSTPLLIHPFIVEPLPEPPKPPPSLAYEQRIMDVYRS